MKKTSKSSSSTSAPSRSRTAKRARINSRAKGAAGERELANYLKEKGFDARRGQQFKGGAESPDVIGLPGVHIECKRVEAGNLYNWFWQAQRDASPLSYPVVMHRRNKEPWVAILGLDDFLAMFGKLIGEQGNE